MASTAAWGSQLELNALAQACPDSVALCSFCTAYETVEQD